MSLTRLVGHMRGVMSGSGRWTLGLLPVVAALAVSGVGARNEAAMPPEYAVVSLQAPASPAHVVQSTFWSVSLGREMPLSVYLPPSYHGNTDPLPVLFMLHGLGGGHMDWQRLGLFDQATYLIESGQIPPMIIVSPAGESGYWIDHFNNGPRYGSYVSKDLIAHIEANYRTVPDRAFRAIGGTSMGAHGALQLGLNNSTEFAIVGAHSLVLRSKQQAFGFFGDQRYFEKHDPVSLLARNPDAARRLTIWIDIGRNDGWHNAANNFHRQLEAQGVPHVWQVWPGGHDSSYCVAHLADYLRFYGDAFRALHTSPVSDPE